MFALDRIKPRNLIAYIVMRLRLSRNAGLLALAVASGLMTGIGIWLFHVGIHFFEDIFVHRLGHDLLEPAVGKLSVIFSLALAGLIVGLIMQRFVGHERHHGVAGVVEAVALTGGRLRTRLMPFKATASALSLGAGASVGPEDPSVQIGSNIGSWLGQVLHLPEERIRLLVAAGAASAIAAAFQAPIAGVFFALEVVLNGSFETTAVGAVVLAAVISSAFTQAVEASPEIVQLTYTLGNPLEILLFVPLGLLLAPVAAYFIKAVYWQHDLWRDRIKLPGPLKTALAGVLVGVVGVFLPEIMGTGRDTMNDVLTGQADFLLVTLVLLGAFKLIMTSVSMAGGFVGGIFAPSLFVGTMLGSLYGRIIIDVFGGGGGMSDAGVFAVAGMAGMMAGVVRSPITAIMLVFELTNDYRLILPIMLTTVMCGYLAERFQPHGVYMFSLHLHGIHLQQGRDIDVMQGVLVNEAMATPAPTINENASLVELRDALRSSRSRTLCVVRGKSELAGIVTLSDLQGVYTATKGESELTVGDICTREVVTCAADDGLWTAIRIMGANDVGRLPVLDPSNGKLVGLIGRASVMQAYNMAISRKLEDQHTAERVRLHSLTGAHVFEVYVAPEAPIVGKHISEVHWPYESVVASIQRKGKLILPHGSTDLRSGDMLTIVADPSCANELWALAGQRPVSSLV